MAHSHGTNDAQKTMGIITLALFTGTKAGSFDHCHAGSIFCKRHRSYSQNG
jgi:PiT family inorganic phosphate transporter